MAYEMNSILNMKGLEIQKFTYEKIATTGTDQQKEQAITDFETDTNNQLPGRPYYDAYHNVVKYWNGSKWIAGAEGALVPKGTLDCSMDPSQETDDKKSNVPATGTLGDTWFVAVTGNYSYQTSGPTSPVTVQKTLNSGDFVFCNFANPDGTGALWSLVESGEGLLIQSFAYDAAHPDTTSWTFTNYLHTMNLVANVYKMETMIEDSSSVDVRIQVGCDLKITNQKIYINFDRPLVADESYIVIATSV